MIYRYTIKPVPDITQAMLDICVQDSLDDLTKSIDGTLAWLKWPGNDPAIFSSDTKYTQEEMRTEIQKAAWQAIDSNQFDSLP